MMAGCSPEEAASNWASDHGLDPAQGPLGLGHRPALGPIDPSPIRPIYPRERPN